MSEKAKRAETAADRWNRAVREAYTETPGADEDASDVSEASDEEIKRQLLAAGVDLAAEDAKADATYHAMMAKLEADERRREAADDAPGSTVAWVAPTELRPEIRAPRSRARRLAYAIAAAATVGGAAYVAAHRTHEPPPEPPPQHDVPVVHPVETAPVPTAAPPIDTSRPNNGKRDRRRRGRITGVRSKGEDDGPGSDADREPVGPMLRPFHRRPHSG